MKKNPPIKRWSGAAIVILTLALLLPVIAQETSSGPSEVINSTPSDEMRWLIENGFGPDARHDRNIPAITWDQASVMRAEIGDDEASMDWLCRCFVTFRRGQSNDIDLRRAGSLWVSAMNAGLSRLENAFKNSSDPDMVRLLPVIRQRIVATRGLQSVIKSGLAVLCTTPTNHAAWSYKLLPSATALRDDLADGAAAGETDQQSREWAKQWLPTISNNQFSMNDWLVATANLRTISLLLLDIRNESAWHLAPLSSDEERVLKARLEQTIIMYRDMIGNNEKTIGAGQQPKIGPAKEN